MTETVEIVEKRKRNAAEVVGVDLDKVTQVRLDIGKMLDNGLLIDIDLHGFSCLKAGVNWEELGIRGGDNRRDRMSTGTKYLAPAKYVTKLTSLEVRYRQYLDKFSSDVAVFRPWRWLAFSAYDDWKQARDALNAELEALKGEIAADYDNIQDENRRYFEQVARRAWKAYQAPYDGEAVVVTDNRAFLTYQEFEDYIVDQALAKMPSVEFIKEGIYADYKTGYAVTPPEVLALYAEQDKALAERSEAEAKARLARQKEREKDIELTERQLEAKARAEAVRQAELEHTRKQLSQAMSPLQEVMTQFRARIYDSVISATKSITTNGHIRGKTAEMLSGLKGLYETLASVTEDTDLETALATLENALARTPVEGSGKYDLNAVESALAGLTSLTREAADQAARAAVQVTRARFLEFD